MKISRRAIGSSLIALLVILGVTVGYQRSLSDADASSHTGEGGGIAATCSFVHREAIDPIRARDGSTSSHMHDFFGSKNVRQFLSADYLLKQAGSCTASGDRSVYWAPTMLEDGVEVDPVNMAVYLQVPHGVAVDDIVLPPNGLEMITFKSSWKCSRWGEEFTDIPRCPRNVATRLILEFPHCWDGQGLKYENGAHVVAADSECPASHPNVLPRITMEVRYDLSSVEDVTFSSGPAMGVHGDLFFVWDQESLKTEVVTCLHGKVMCGVTWSTEFGA